MPLPEFNAVVYPASLGGILVARELRQQGFRPLILNPTGFPGGAICETLALIQRIPTGPDLDLPKGLEARLQEAWQPLPAAGKHLVRIDSESWKRVLWDLMETLELPILAHVTPWNVTAQDAEIEIAYLQREGRASIKVKRVVDCSPEGFLCRLQTSREVSASHGMLHVLATVPRFHQLPPDLEVSDLGDQALISRKIAGNWLSQPELELDTELEQLAALIEEAGGNLQVIPMRPLVFPDEQIIPGRILWPGGRVLNASDEILREEWELDQHVRQTL